MVFPKLFRRIYSKNNEKVDGTSESSYSVPDLHSSSQTSAPGTSISASVYSGTTYASITSSTIEESLKIDYGNEHSTSSSSSSLNDAYGVTTVFSQKPATFTPSIQIDTITTDALPSNYYAASNSSSCSLVSNSSISYQVTDSSTYPTQSIWNSRYYSNSKYNANSNLSLFSSFKTTESVSVYSDPPVSSTTKSYKTSSYIPTKTSTHKFETSKPSSSSSSLTSPTSSTTSISSDSVGRLTTTVIQYYEDLTYTQVYVVTDTETTITTSVLATTSFIVTNESGTYSIMPPAITTDMAAFKSTHDFASLISSNGLSKGSIAGIVVGVILGVLFFSVFIFFILRKKRTNKRNEKKSNFSNNGNDDNFDNSDNYDNYDDPELGNNGDFEEHLPELEISKNREKSRSLDSSKKLSTTLPSPSPLFIKPPPIPKRTLKPISFDSPLSSPNEPEFPITPTQNYDSDNYLSPIDTSLFDMKSTIESMGSPIALQQTPVPIPPPSRKSSPNAINKMTHNILRATPPPDRTMDILYETPNEGGNNESFWGNKNRFRSSSVAKRYESLSSNVSSFKNELERDKMNSPISPPPIPKPRKNLNSDEDYFGDYYGDYPADYSGDYSGDDSGVVDTLLFLNTVQKKDDKNDIKLKDKKKNVREKKKESDIFEFGSDDDIDTDELSSSIDSV